MKWIILFWILNTMNAPTWVWCIYWVGIVLTIIVAILDAISKRVERKNKRDLLKIIEDIANLVGEDRK